MATNEAPWQTVGRQNPLQPTTNGKKGPPNKRRPPSRRQEQNIISRSNPNVLRVYARGPLDKDGEPIKEMMTREQWNECFDDLMIWIKHFTALHRGQEGLRSKTGIDNFSFSVDKNQPIGEGEKGSGFILMNTDEGVTQFMQTIPLVSIKSAGGTMRFVGVAQRDDKRPYISFECNPQMLRHNSPKEVLIAVEDSYPNLKANHCEIVKVDANRKSVTIIAVKTSDEYLRMLRGEKMYTDTRCGKLPWTLSARDRTREKEAEKARALAIIEGSKPPTRPRWTSCTSDTPAGSRSKTPPPGCSGAPNHRSSSTSAVPWHVTARALRDAEILARQAESSSSDVEDITPPKTPDPNANKRQRIDRSQLNTSTASTVPMSP